MAKTRCGLAMGILGVVGTLYGARPVARWDVVPYQRVAGTFEAGVVAFHEKGVTVEFSVNGKAAFTAEKPTLNPRTKVWEYVFPFDSSKCADGPVTLSARVKTPDGESLALPDLPLYADSLRSLGSRRTVWVDSKNGNDFADGSAGAPLQTLRGAIAKVGDGGTVYLRRGRYAAVRLGGRMKRKHWTLVSAAPGVNREDVLVEGGRMGTDKLRFRSIVLFCDLDVGEFGSVLIGENGKTSCWVENCLIQNRKGSASRDARPFGNRLIAYVTGGVTQCIGRGPDAVLVRGHEVRDVSSCAFSMMEGLVVNCRVSKVAPTDGGDANVILSHAPDSSWVHDLIVYNLAATEIAAHGLYGDQMRDCAFVNISCSSSAPEKARIRSQYGGRMENVLFAHVAVSGQPWIWHEGQEGKSNEFRPKDVRALNCRFEKLLLQRPADGSKGLLQAGCAVGESSVAGVAIEGMPTDLNGAPYPAEGPRPCGALAK